MCVCMYFSACLCVFILLLLIFYFVFFSILFLEKERKEFCTANRFSSVCLVRSLCSSRDHLLSGPFFFIFWFIYPASANQSILLLFLVRFIPSFIQIFTYTSRCCHLFFTISSFFYYVCLFVWCCFILFDLCTEKEIKKFKWVSIFHCILWILCACVCIQCCFSLSLFIPCSGFHFVCVLLFNKND